MNRDLAERAAAIRLVTCDVDGVLTDGRIVVDDAGHESKAFSVLDGLGIRMLQRAGITVAWITGSQAPAVRHRARHLGVEHVLTGLEHKVEAWRALVASLGLAGAACAHIGDDLPDVALFAHCGLAATVPHAPDAVKRHAHYVTRRDGGQGAVREFAEVLLAAQGRLAEVESWCGLPAASPRG